MSIYMSPCQMDIYGLWWTQMTDDILTIKELSAYLKTSEKTIYRLLSKDEIPAFKVGTSWRFKKEAIDDWIEHQSKESA